MTDSLLGKLKTTIEHKTDNYWLISKYSSDQILFFRTKKNLPNILPGNLLFFMLQLFQFKNVLVWKELQCLIGIIDTELLEAIP